MKYFSFIILFYGSQLFAQSELDLRINASGGVASMLMLSGQGYKPIVSYNMGISLEKDKKLSLTFRMAINRNGGFTDYYNIKIRLQYLILSAQLKYQIENKGAIYIGPYIGVRTNNNIKGDISDITYGLRESYKNSDYGLYLIEAIKVNNRLNLIINQLIGVQNLIPDFYGFHPNQGNWVGNISAQIGLSYKLSNKPKE